MDKNFRIRLGAGFLIICLLCSAVIVRSVYLMLIPSKVLSDTLAKQFRQSPRPQPRRGLILDRNREPLAVSLDVRSLYANPGKIKNDKKVARAISKILKIPIVKLLQKFNQDKDFVWVKRYLTKEEETKIRELLDRDRKLNLVFGFARESKRFYPNAELAAHILGFTGIDSNGLEGLEYYYENQLSGKDNNENVTEGKNLILTVDKGLQHTLENELQSGVGKVNAKAGVGIVMDADTGDIWAMASYPTYNPNDFQNSNPEWRRNRAITESFEPGSTIKTILVSGAIEQELIKENTKFFCENGKMQIGKHWIKESSMDHNWEWLTVRNIIKYSSNIGATKIGFKLGRENLYKWYLNQGLATKTEIDLPGEALGLLSKPEQWPEIQFSNIAFGQGMSSTAIQIIRSFAVIANGGFLVKPRLVSELEDPDSKSIQKLPIQITRVLKLSTTHTITTMLGEVTEGDGTGVKASIPGFKIAGKTGTAQVAQQGKGYAIKKYIASFVGFPINIKPNLIGLVVIFEPEFPNIFGGEVAAPIFQKVLSVALARSGVYPNQEEKINSEILLTKKNLPETVIPKVDVAVENVLGRLNSIQEKEFGEYVMPGLEGLSAREVLNNFSGKAVQLNIKGTGIVAEQFPKRGQIFKKGQNITIYLRSQDKYSR